MDVVHLRCPTHGLAHSLTSLCVHFVIDQKRSDAVLSIVLCRLQNLVLGQSIGSNLLKHLGLR